MMINPKFILPLLITITLISCSSNIPSPQPTSTKRFNSPTPTILVKTPTVTETPTFQPTPSFTPTLVPTPLLNIPAYPTKHVILEYSFRGGGLGSPDSLLDVFFGDYREWFRFVLYSDDQFILQEWSKPIRTKILTKDEKNQLFSQLDKKGFYSIDTNQTSDETNPIYDFKGRYNEVGVTDGSEACLSVNIPTPKKVCIYEPYREFLVPQIKDLFQFMDRYTPGNLTVYRPDRLLLFVSNGRGFYNSYDFFVTPSIASVSWPAELPSLETEKEKYIYLEGKNVTKALSLLKNSVELMVFSEKGEDYSVFMEVVFPHKNLTSP